MITMECSYWCTTHNRWCQKDIECYEPPISTEPEDKKVKKWWKNEVKRIRDVYGINADTMIIRAKKADK